MQQNEATNNNNNVTYNMHSVKLRSNGRLGQSPGVLVIEQLN